MSENLKQSLTYSLGLIHGTKNVLNRVLKFNTQRYPIETQRHIDFNGLVERINETQVVSENGKFILNDKGEIEFDWIAGRGDLIIAELNAEL